MHTIASVLQNIVEPTSFKAQYSDRRWREKARAHRRTHNSCNSCKCNDRILHVHHVNYAPGKPIWEAEDTDLVTLCEDCHALITEATRDFRKLAAFSNAGNIAKLVLCLSAMIQRSGDQKTMIKVCNLPV